ncbi:MAG: benzoate/H(+) symporter BenE family transporter [Pseudoxanthomonas sp.]|nr:benzoate/H(+) symporter BenE family transporter [Pseudoxanthomonas sp.]MBP7464958.1 benzoate/H(+) symporter BenE family transporter [Pseudoxanthomonas sp.]MBP8741951.1 benzoate/H(+) symporter BenE family transporter [Pseudoxanthomonas sp.]MBP8803708.1 benzoate/H(+) symporter BenE family transporter [Pseudoxanthomonas sp.]MBP8907813.1 benzoate/H(+) symporter BenE family transporter [Pseudoxanthomonas sp.]
MIRSASVSLFRDSSVSSIAAGFVTVLVGFASTAAIVFQAAQALDATPAQTASWMWALGIGMGATCIALSLRWKMPVVTAWSTPGAAVLATSAAGVSMGEAVAGFLVSALLIAIAGFSGIFERMLGRIPLSLASAMLAGVLLRFGIDAFAAIQAAPALVLSMLATWLLARRWWPRYAVIATLLAGIAAAALAGQLHLAGLRLELAQPVWTTPRLSLASILGVALPLFVVTMASQNVPGVAAIRASGYPVPVSPAIGWTGVASLLLAPFGAFALNLAAITAAICMGPEAHADPARRYTAAVWAGLFYLLVGLFGATVAGLFAAFPQALVLAIAGIALFGTLGNSLVAALREEDEREAALVTFLVTASGLSLLGVGAAFWGLVAGVCVRLALRRKRDDDGTGR